MVGRFVTCSIVSVLTIAIDQATKSYAIEFFSRLDAPQRVEVTPFMNFVLLFNPGVTFGILGDSGISPLLLSAVSLGVVMLLVYWLIGARSWLVRFGLAAMSGGALGNIADRLRQGAVTDFIDVHAYGWHWPAFNTADIGIVAGGAILIVGSYFDPQNK